MRILAAFTILLALAASAPAETLRGKNFSSGREVTTVTLEGDRVTTYTDCNFSTGSLQQVAGEWVAWPIDLATSAAFANCNFTGSKPPEGSVLIHCNMTLRRNQLKGADEDLEFVDDKGTTFTKRVPTYYNEILGVTVWDGKAFVADYFPSPTIRKADMPEQNQQERDEAELKRDHEAYRAAEVEQLEKAAKAKAASVGTDE